MIDWIRPEHDPVPYWYYSKHSSSIWCLNDSSLLKIAEIWAPVLPSLCWFASYRKNFGGWHWLLLRQTKYFGLDSKSLVLDLMTLSPFCRWKVIYFRDRRLHMLEGKSLLLYQMCKGSSLLWRNTFNFNGHHL